VHESVYDEICDELVAIAKSTVVDDGSKQGTKLGPLQNKMQYEKVKGFLEDARKNGNIIAGGSAMDRPGYFIEPTLVRDIKEGSRLVDEEQFGPVLPVIPYRDLDDAVARANGTHFGLSASVWSADPDRAAAVAERLDSGTAWVNTHLANAPHQPFGGMKWSGVGVENGPWGLMSFTELQVVHRAKS
jgi:acyl-CoA reductase-like NAD-dependent aldehyde dehydrogenase